MILTRISGGLGNQFFQYAAALALAHRHGVPFLLDTGWYHQKEDRHFVLDRFEAPVALLTAAQKQRYCHSRWHKLLHRIGMGQHHPTLKDPKWTAVALEQAPAQVYLFGYWTGPQYFAPVAHRLPALYTLQQQYHTPGLAALLQYIAAAPTVAIHIRRGDYTDAFNAGFFGVLPAEYYTAAIHTLQARLPGPLQYLVFSDDTAWVRAHHAFPQGTRFAADFGSHPDYIELTAMRHCHHFITANSTFSWWGAWLGAHPGKTIVMPARWYLHEAAQQAYQSGATLYMPGAILL